MDTILISRGLERKSYWRYALRGQFGGQLSQKQRCADWYLVVIILFASLRQVSKNLGKFLGKWNGEYETGS